jgi:tetratricopeptide (TPR) repeat protein
MNDLLDDVATQLRHFSHKEIVALVRDFLAGLDEKYQTRFLNLVAQGPRPLVAEAMGLEDAEALLDEIQVLHDAIAGDVYVEYGAGYDPEYGEYRGFGDDSWIDEMDDLFAAATSFFRAGRFEAAADAYIALFDIFDLNQDGFHFTRPDPAEALHADVDAMKEYLFIAIGRCALSAPEEGYSEAASRAIQVSGDVYTYGHNRYALLDAWEGREELMAALEAALIALCRQSASQRHGLSSHPAELLREFYRRYGTSPDYETLCRQVGPQQGWPYEDLAERYQQQQNWAQVLAWVEAGLEKLPAESRYRPFLQEARGQVLIHLGRPAEALDELQALFQQQPWAAPVYLKLRQAAQAAGRWEALYPQLTAGMQAHVLATDWELGYPVVILTEAGLLGYAYLLEGDCERAVEWASNPDVPDSWWEDDLTLTVAAGLLRMGLAASVEAGDEVLAQVLRDAPTIIREHGELLQPVAHALPAGQLLDSAVQLYERRVERAIGGRDRNHYAEAGAFCQVIRSIRRVQGREADFERYYRGLFAIYSRFPALKDELRKAIEGPGRPAR